MKGFRHVLQGEPQRDLMLKPDFMKGLGHLHRYNFTYDLLIYPDQLQYLPTLVSSFPQQAFVIDHIAKPPIKAGLITNWKKDIKALGQFENLHCKISGMVTEAGWNTWKREHFKPYLDVIVDTFGTDRIMFGSDWPVCLVAASYEDVLGIVEDYFAVFSREEQDRVFALNAGRFYNL